LGRAPTAATWVEIRGDPGAVLLVVRHAPPSRPFLPASLDDPALLEGALLHLEQPPTGFVDWAADGVRPAHQAGLTYARLARRLAERTALCDPEEAWVCGLLAPLGWLAVAAVDARALSACLADPDRARDPGQAEQRWWGLDQAALARRLARRWR